MRFLIFLFDFLILIKLIIIFYMARKSSKPLKLKKMALKKPKCSQLFVVSKKKKPPDLMMMMIKFLIILIFVLISH